MGTGSPACSAAPHQSREQTCDVTSLKETQISTDVHDDTGLGPLEKPPRRNSPQEQITSESGTTEQSTLENGVVEQISEKTRCPPGNNYETSGTGSTSPEMTASTSTAGDRENEPSQHSVSGKKRRRTGARSSGKGKRKKSRTTMDSKVDDRELRDKLPRRFWNGTSYKVEVC